MQEEFLHFVWQYQKLNKTEMKTVSGALLQIVSVGQENHDAGPDFFNARIYINEQEWAGNVEIHIKSSDWYAHGHETDPAYDNIVLHVVWEDDIVVFDKYNEPIPTLELKNSVEVSLLNNYKKLLSYKGWVNCEKQIASVDQFTRNRTKEVLLLNRLEAKSREVINLLKENKNDWEAVLFLLLARSFGLKKNSDAFYEIAQSIGFLIFKKELFSELATEALLLGQANLLAGELEDTYYLKLQKEHKYLQHKYQLVPWMGNVQFFRMRPASFPTLRLSQFAQLYARHKKLWAKIMECNSIQELKKIFQVSTSVYWQSHYTFGKNSTKRIKLLSSSFVELLIINTIIPLKYVYEKKVGNEARAMNVLSLYEDLQPEANAIINKFKKLGLKVMNAGDSQALLHLKKNYCNLNKCLHCRIGNKLLYAKSSIC